MSGELAPPSSDVGSSSSCSNGQLDESSSGEQNDVAGHIVELSEIIVHELDNNTWGRSSHGEQTIFRVPKEKLHAADKGSYQPTFLSFGPYHREDATEEMRRNEQGKLWWLGSSVRDGGPSVLQLTQAVASMEAQARSCYEGDVKMDRDAFIKMLLLDAIQLIPPLGLLGKAQVLQEEAADPSSGPTSPSNEPHDAGAAAQGYSIKTRDMMMTIHDLMMLENQIPFFVVEKMYEMCNGDAATTGNGTERVPAHKLAWGAIKTIMDDVPPASDDGVDKCKHLVHLCHVYLKPTCVHAPETGKYCRETGKYGRFRRASEYYEDGVKFRRWDADNGRRRPMLDVTFSDGVLRMPLQSVDDKMGYTLRNVLAYEQKYYRNATSAPNSYVTAYVVFMSQLLGSPEDVAVLSRRGVLEHLLGNDGEVCALFRGLADGLVFDPASEHYLNPVGVALQGHCRTRRHRWHAWVVRHRFSNPWLGAAWVFGAFAVLGTIVQTVFAVLSYVKGG